MRRPTQGRLNALASTVPGGVVLAAILGLLWWGHRTGWKAPRFSELTGRGPAPAEAEDWCSEHRVPESKCLACNPELAGRDPSDWCREHGVPESRCSACHPEILHGAAPRDWCAEHGVPESQCNLCNPEVARVGPEPPPREPDVQVSATVPAAGNSPNCTLHEVRVQFASADAVPRAGIRVEAAEERPFAEHLRAPGEIEYDQDRIARIASRAQGTAWRVDRKLGDRVGRGDVLAVIDSAEAGKARAELFHALAARDARERAAARIGASAEKGLRTQGDLQEAEAGLQAAKVQVMAAHQTLLNLGLRVALAEVEAIPKERVADEIRFIGLPEDVRSTLGEEVATANLIPLFSPLDGIVVARDVVAGESVDSARPIFTVADTRRMWAVLSVRLEDARRLGVGQPVVFRPDGDSMHAAEGRLAWIGTAVDETTRTVQARAEVENPDGRLLAHTFGSASVRVRESDRAIAVPEEAVQWEGCCNIVFVRSAPDIFLTRKVSLGARGGPFREVLAGVAPGELVATTGSAVLKSEILRSRLGAGCAGE